MSLPCRSLSYSLEALISALEGMQPTLRQMPPTLSFSRTMAFLPSCPSRMPAT
jgi:hypothetical protein